MSKSYLEAITVAIIKEAGIPTPIREFRLTEHRRWHCDFVWVSPYPKVVLEIEGGVWMKKGGHNTGTGITRDIEKYNEAALLGFIVIRATKEHIENGQMIAWLKRALGLV